MGGGGDKDMGVDNKIVNSRTKTLSKMFSFNTPG